MNSFLKRVINYTNTEDFVELIVTGFLVSMVAIITTLVITIIIAFVNFSTKSEEQLLWLDKCISEYNRSVNDCLDDSKKLFDQ